MFSAAHVHMLMCVSVQYMCVSHTAKTPFLSSTHTLEYAYDILLISAGGLTDPFVEMHGFFKSQPVPAVPDAHVCVCECVRQQADCCTL